MKEFCIAGWRYSSPFEPSGGTMPEIFPIFWRSVPELESEELFIKRENHWMRSRQMPMRPSKLLFESPFFADIQKKNQVIRLTTGRESKKENLWISNRLSLKSGKILNTIFLSSRQKMITKAVRFAKNLMEWFFVTMIRIFRNFRFIRIADVLCSWLTAGIKPALRS